MSKIFTIIALTLILAGCDSSFLQEEDMGGGDETSTFPTDTKGDPASGEQIAYTWCTTCHATAAGRQGSDVGPAWSTIAVNREKTDDYLRVFLTNPHGQMQGISLTRQQINDVIAYIRTLGGRSNDPDSM